MQLPLRVVLDSVAVRRRRPRTHRDYRGRGRAHVAAGRTGPRQAAGLVAVRTDRRRSTLVLQMVLFRVATRRQRRGRLVVQRRVVLVVHRRRNRPEAVRLDVVQQHLIGNRARLHDSVVARLDLLLYNFQFERVVVDVVAVVRLLVEIHHRVVVVVVLGALGQFWIRFFRRRGFHGRAGAVQAEREYRRAARWRVDARAGAVFRVAPARRAIFPRVLPRKTRVRRAAARGQV